MHHRRNSQKLETPCYFNTLLWLEISVYCVVCYNNFTLIRDGSPTQPEAATLTLHKRFHYGFRVVPSIKIVNTTSHKNKGKCNKPGESCSPRANFKCVFPEMHIEQFSFLFWFYSNFVGILLRYILTTLQFACFSRKKKVRCWMEPQNLQQASFIPNRRDINSGCSRALCANPVMTKHFYYYSWQIWQLCAGNTKL